MITVFAIQNIEEIVVFIQIIPDLLIHGEKLQTITDHHTSLITLPLAFLDHDADTERALPADKIQAAGRFGPCKCCKRWPFPL